MTGREIAHHRRTGDHEVCESLESLLTDSKSVSKTRSGLTGTWFGPGESNLLSEHSFRCLSDSCFRFS